MSAYVVSLFRRFLAWIAGSSGVSAVSEKSLSPAVDSVAKKIVVTKSHQRKWITPEQRQQLKDLRPGAPIKISGELSGPDEYDAFSGNVCANLINYHGTGKCHIRKIGRNKLMAWRVE